jgi:hypothetical protein
MTAAAPERAPVAPSFHSTGLRAGISGLAGLDNGTLIFAA